MANEALDFTYERGRLSPLSAVEFEQLALQEVSKQISSAPSEPGYGTILAAALLANHKELKEEHALAEWHWNGLKRMISLRGGVYCLRTHEELHALLFWLDILVCNAFHCSLGQLSCLQNSGEASHMRVEFVEFFDSIADHVSTVVGRRESPMIPPRTLHALHRPTFLRDKCAQIKWRRAKLACFVHLTALLLQNDSQIESPTQSALSEIEQQVALREKLCDVPPEELLHILLRTTNQDNLCEWIWFTSRIMNVIKQLPLKTLNTCSDVLSAFLKYGDCTLTIDGALQRWRSISTSLLYNTTDLSGGSGLQQ